MVLCPYFYGFVSLFLWFWVLISNGFVSLFLMVLCPYFYGLCPYFYDFVSLFLWFCVLISMVLCPHRSSAV